MEKITDRLGKKYHRLTNQRGKGIPGSQANSMIRQLSPEFDHFHFYLLSRFLNCSSNEPLLDEARLVRISLLSAVLENPQFSLLSSSRPISKVIVLLPTKTKSSPMGLAKNSNPL